PFQIAPVEPGIEEHVINPRPASLVPHDRKLACQPSNVNAFNTCRKRELELAVAATQHRRIHSHAYGFAALGNCSLHHVASKAAVALNVELEPDRLLNILRDLVDTRRGKRTDHHTGAACIRT